jgi:hypothetical protein
LELGISALKNENSALSLLLRYRPPKPMAATPATLATRATLCVTAAMHPAAMGIDSHTLQEAPREMTKPLTLQEIFPTPTAIRLLDLILQKPETPWTQGALAKALAADPGSIRTAIQHLQTIGLVEVHTPTRVGPMKAITLRLDTPLGAALLAFHQALAPHENTALQ